MKYDEQDAWIAKLRKAESETARLRAQVEAYRELVEAMDRRFEHLARQHGHIIQCHCREVSEARAKLRGVADA